MKKINFTKNRFFLFLLLSSLSTQFIFSQGQQVVNAKYDRNSLSNHFVLFSNGNDIGKSIFENAKVPDKYDDNSFGSNTFQIVGLNNPFQVEDDSQSKKKKDNSKNKDENKSKLDELLETEKSNPYYAQILAGIKDSKIPNNILKKILLDANNQTSTSELFKRGEYNATDAQVIAAKNSKEGLSVLQSYGLTSLLYNIYFTVNLNGPLSTKYDNSLKANITTTSFKSYLFKIDLNENFWTDFWWDGQNEEKYKKFMGYDFPIKLISVHNSTALASDQKIELVKLKPVTTTISREEVISLLVSSMIDDGMNAHAKNHEPLQVKTTVFSTGPITAKIGKKEGLKIDDRYQVFENREKTSGEKISKSMGYVRASKVFDNRSVATGNTETSKFYKAPARRVDKGMIMRELPEAGIQVGMEIGIPLTYRDPLFLANIDYVTHLVKGNRAGISAGVESGQFIALAEVKQVIQMNKLTLTPGFGYAFRANEDGDLVDYGVSGQLKLGLDIGKNFQINLGPRFFLSYDAKAYMSIGLRLFGF